MFTMFSTVQYRITNPKMCGNTSNLKIKTKPAAGIHSNKKIIKTEKIIESIHSRSQDITKFT